MLFNIKRQTCTLNRSVQPHVTRERERDHPVLPETAELDAPRSQDEESRAGGKHARPEAVPRNGARGATGARRPPCQRPRQHRWFLSSRSWLSKISFSLQKAKGDSFVLVTSGVSKSTTQARAFEGTVGADGGGTTRTLSREGSDVHAARPTLQLNRNHLQEAVNVPLSSLGDSCSENLS